MPALTTYGPGSSVNLEDKSGLISEVEPQDHPLQSLANREKAKGMLSEWHTDEYKQINYEAQPETKDTTVFANKGSKRSLLWNRIQICGKDAAGWQTSREQELANKAGIASEVARSKTRALMELKRDIECCIGSDQEVVHGGDRPQMRAMGRWISTSDVSADNTDHKAEEGQINTTPTSDLTEEDITEMIQAIYYNTGNKAQNLNGVFGGALMLAASRALSRFEGTNTAKSFFLTADAMRFKVPLKVTEYITDFGNLNMIPTVFNGVDADGDNTDEKSRARGYVFPAGSYTLRTYMPLNHTDGVDQGGGRRGFWQTDLTLAPNNVRTFGKFAAVS